MFELWIFLRRLPIEKFLQQSRQFEARNTTKKKERERKVFENYFDDLLWELSLQKTSFCLALKLSVTRLGDSYKFLVTNCLIKVAQIFWWLFGLFLIMALSSKSGWLLFGHIWGKIRQPFIPSSGHTAQITVAYVFRYLRRESLNSKSESSPSSQINQTVWPDSAIFEWSWRQKFHAKIAHFEKHPCLCGNSCGYFLGKFRQKWATFYSDIWSHCNLNHSAQWRSYVNHKLAKQ